MAQNSDREELQQSPANPTPEQIQRWKAGAEMTDAVHVAFFEMAAATLREPPPAGVVGSASLV